MKTASIFLGLLLFGFFSYAQNNVPDSTGLPGDNFDLQGALQIFQNSPTPEDFEKKINEKENSVNNIDLNGDGEVDYISVIDKAEGNIHLFILQVAVSENETQDIAVIELEKTGEETAVIQIIGDEDIYGEEMIVEPESEKNDMSATNWISGGKMSGPSLSATGFESGVFMNVWFWPSVRFVYTPAYRPWVSPWRWHYYPTWWKPWRPFHWQVWHPRCAHYHRSFVVVHTHRIVRGRAIYTPFRSTSVTVRNRNTVAVTNYRVTRTKTTVTGPRGRTATKKTTTVTGKRGKVKATKTTVKRRH